MSVAFFSGKVKGGKFFAQISRPVTRGVVTARYLMSYDMGHYASLPCSFVSYCKEHSREPTSEFRFKSGQKNEFYRNIGDFLKTFGLFEQDSEEKMRKSRCSYLDMFRRIQEQEPEEDISENDVLMALFEEKSAIVFVNSEDQLLNPVVYGEISVASPVFFLVDEDEICELDLSNTGRYILGLDEEPKIHQSKEKYQYIIPRLNDRVEQKVAEFQNRPVPVIEFAVNRGKWVTVFREDNVTKLEYLLGCAGDRDDKMWFNFQNFAIKTQITVGMIGRYSNILIELRKCKEWTETSDNNNCNVDYQKRLEEMESFQADCPTLVYCLFIQGLFILVLPNNASPNDPLYADCSRWAYQFLKKVCRTVILVPDKDPMEPIGHKVVNVKKGSLLQSIRGMHLQKVSAIQANGSGHTFNVVAHIPKHGSRKRTFVDFQHFSKWLSRLRSWDVNVSTDRLVNRTCCSEWWNASTSPQNCWFRVESDGHGHPEAESGCLNITSLTSLDNGSIVIEVSEDNECCDLEFYRLCDETEEGRASFASQPVHPDLVCRLRDVESSTRIINSWFVDDGILILGYFNNLYTELIFLRRYYDDYWPECVYRCDIRGVPSSGSYCRSMRVVVFCVGDSDTGVVVSLSLDESYHSIFSRQRSLCDFYPLIREKSRSKCAFGGLVVSDDGLVGHATFTRGGYQFIVMFSPSDLSISGIGDGSSITGLRLADLNGCLVPLYSSHAVSYFAGIRDNMMGGGMKKVGIWELANRKFVLRWEQEVYSDTAVNDVVGLCLEENIFYYDRRDPNKWIPTIHTMAPSRRIMTRCGFSPAAMMEFAVSTLSEYGIGSVERKCSPGGQYSPLELQTVSVISNNVGGSESRISFESVSKQVSYLESSVDIPVMFEVLPSDYELWLMSDSKSVGVSRNGLFPLLSKFFMSPRFAVLDPIVDSVSHCYSESDDDSYFYERRIRSSLVHPFIRMTSLCNDSDGLVTSRPNRIISLINMGCDDGSSLLSSISGIPFMDAPTNSLLIGSNAIPIYPDGCCPDGDCVFKHTDMDGFCNVECLLYSVSDCDCSESVFAFGSAVYGSEYVILNFPGDINEVDRFFIRVLSADLGWSEISMSLSDTCRIQIFIVCEMSSSSSLVIEKIKERFAQQNEFDDNESEEEESESGNSLCRIMKHCDFIFIDRNDKIHELSEYITTNMMSLTDVQSGRFRCPITRMTVMSAIFGAGIDQLANS